MPSPSKSNIYFFFEQAIDLRERTRLKSFLHRLFVKEGKRLESLNYIFCSDKRLLSINQQYLSHNDYTDIITFELSPPGSPITGEIYISIDRVRENAKLLNISVKAELHRVIFHGALHLCGYEDKSKAAKHEMREMEDYYLRQYVPRKTVSG